MKLKRCFLASSVSVLLGLHCPKFSHSYLYRKRSATFNNRTTGWLTPDSCFKTLRPKSYDSLTHKYTQLMSHYHSGWNHEKSRTVSVARFVHARSVQESQQQHQHSNSCCSDAINFLIGYYFGLLKTPHTGSHESERVWDSLCLYLQIGAGFNAQSETPHVLEGDGLAVRVEGVGVEEGEGVRVADARLSCWL